MKKNLNLLSWLSITLLVMNSTACGPAKDQYNTPAVDPFVGDYVTEGYEKRAEGYDWVCVSVIKKDDTTAHVSVRARADRKKPTCSFEAEASLFDNNKLKTSYEDKDIFFLLKGDTLEIAAGNEESGNLLFYFCSGGATLEGAYLRVDSLMDTEQLAWRTFQDTLGMQGVSFVVTVISRFDDNELTIQPSGLEIDNQAVIHHTGSWITGAEIEDLNSDGSPEILVYATDFHNDNAGTVIGYSVNNGKSMSQVYFPGIEGNPEAMKGYRGFDEFAIVETSLVQRFPTFKTDEAGNVTGEPTGMTRQIQYKLADGEASRYFRIDRIVEY